MAGRRSPKQELLAMADHFGVPANSADFARCLDSVDPLRSYRDRFSMPRMADVKTVDPAFIKDPDETCVYLVGHSLGLMPKTAELHVQKVLNNWATTGAEAHMHGYLPAASCDLAPKRMMADLVGAQPEEIVFMNGLTVNLHLLLLTYYKPVGKRCKMVIESDAFPSDMYAAQSQVSLHGLDVDSNLILLKPRKGEHLLREEDILDLIENEGDTIAVLLLPGIQYYTGQLLNIKLLTGAARKKGCLVLWDMAHAICNAELKLNEWGVDLAVWCTYKYMNCGPGSLGTAFVSNAFRKTNPQLPALRGWWGNRPDTKFLMSPQFDPCPSADVFKLSNCPPLLVGTVMASLEMFKEIKESERLQKQFLLTGYMEFLLTEELGASHDINDPTRPFHILSPKDPSQRGSQLSIHLAAQPHITHRELQRRGVLCDLRMPSVVRLAPVPLYNSFMDVFRCVSILKEVCSLYLSKEKQCANEP
ncbi:unnamed protein product [Ixodes hexagonus]